MLTIAVVSITHRTLNNIAPLLQALIAQGARCEVIWAPTSQRVEGQSPADFGLEVGLAMPGLNAKDAAAMAQFRSACQHHLAQLQPDLVLSDDMTTWPNRIVHEIVREMPSRPWQLAWQHGLHQPWYEMGSAFDTDFFLCYGRLHAFLLGDALAARVLPVGLPKLDRLGATAVLDDGYLAWFAQPLPEAQVQVALLRDIARVTGLPVRLRPHPAAPQAFTAFDDLAARGLHLDDPAGDPIECLRRCRGFLSTHSSAALEALLLGKTAVLFPSFGLTSFPGYPNVASDFSARAYQVALGRHAARRAATDRFLDDCIGGRRFDHTARNLRAVEGLAALRRSGLALADLTLRHTSALCSPSPALP